MNISFWFDGFFPLMTQTVMLCCICTISLLGFFLVAGLLLLLDITYIHSDSINRAKI